MSSMSDLNNVRRPSGYFGRARQTRDLLLVEDGAELSSSYAIVAAYTNLGGMSQNHPVQLFLVDNVPMPIHPRIMSQGHPPAVPKLLGSLYDGIEY